MQKPKVSVVVPFFNEEKYAEKAIKSVLSQTFTDYEIILVDDGSTDKTVDTIRPLLIENSNIHYIRNEVNEGIAVSRNRGIENANGEYVAFLSADDEWFPNYLKEMLELCEKIGYDDFFIYSNYRCINEQSKVWGNFEAPKYDTFEKLLMGVVFTAKKNKMFINYSSIMAKKSVWEKTRFNPQFRYGEDLWHTLYSILVKKIPFVLHTSYLVKYRMHPHNTTTKKFSEIAQNNKMIFADINKLAGKEVL